MYSSTLTVMRQRAVTLSIYTVTDNTVTLHQSERHQYTHSPTHIQSTGTKFRGINSLRHVINPTLPPTVRKEGKFAKKEKWKYSALNAVLLSPSFLHLFCFPSLFCLDFYSISSSFSCLLLSYPLLINLSSPAASARPP